MSETNGLRERFIQKLEEKYGEWNRTTSRFGNSSFGEISNALSISSSQFTKLISGTATDGMYLRSIENIERLIKRDSIRDQLEKAREKSETLQSKLGKVHKKYLVFGSIILLASFIAGGLLIPYKSETAMKWENFSDHPLSAFFDNAQVEAFKSPYLDISEIQDFCPCSAFEGEWTLADSYKLPLPGSKKPGLYYTAKSADVRMKCSRNDTLGSGPGRVLLGYEYLVNEIWIDTELTPLSPKYFDKTNKRFTKEFDELIFEENIQFKKIATINSFFIDRFEIYDTQILRKGEPCGRFASEIDEDLANEFNVDIEYILKNILSNLTTTACEPAVNAYCDPNDLNNGGIISFDCLYTIETENLGIGGGYPYQKAYKLNKQIYTDNLTCECQRDKGIE